MACSYPPLDENSPPLQKRRIYPPPPSKGGGGPDKHWLSFVLVSPRLLHSLPFSSPISAAKRQRIRSQTHTTGCHFKSLVLQAPYFKKVHLEIFRKTPCIVLRMELLLPVVQLFRAACMHARNGLEHVSCVCTKKDGKKSSSSEVHILYCPARAVGLPRLQESHLKRDRVYPCLRRV